METGRADAFVARRLERRRVSAPAAAALLIGLALVAAGCAPTALESGPTPEASTGLVQPSTDSAPRYRRSGVQGNGESTGRIVRIGAALSLTGSAKLFGAAQRSGIKLAQDEINASHVLGSTRLEVIVEDDASDREQASAVFQKFIENSHVLAIMGPTLSDTALSVDPLAQQASVPTIGSNAFNSDTVLRSAGDAAEGLIVGSAWSAANPSARNQQLIQSYRARYGVDPDQLATQAYTGVYILASAIQDANTTTDPRAVRDALERVNKLDTPLGQFSFNAHHDADYPPTVQIVRKGRLQLF